jgi:DNA-binding NarL/FixJ family response regulator/signal transduction histidine kinase
LGTDYAGWHRAHEIDRLLDTGPQRSHETRHGRDGLPVETQSVTMAIQDNDGELSGFAGIAHDVSESRHSQRELESRIQQQAAVAELGISGLGHRSLTLLLDDAVLLVCRGLRVETASVYEPLRTGAGLVMTAGAGWPEGFVGTATIAAGDGSPPGYALLSGEPVIVDDLSADSRFQTPGLLSEHGIVSVIAVAIDGAESRFGALAALSSKRRRFSKHDLNFVQSIANVLGTAAERASVDQRLELAREAERRRIARDLHDSALRALADALAIATISRSESRVDDEQRWSAVIGGLQDVTLQVRSAIYDLRLPGDGDRDFAELLSELVAVQADLATDTELSLHGRASLPAGSLGHRGTELLRIVREAVTNSRRHSHATTILVDAGGSSGDLIRLTITDNGTWPDRESAIRRSRGSGIDGMRVEGWKATFGLGLGMMRRPQGNNVRTVRTSSPIRVVVGEDQPIYRDGVVHVLREAGFDVVAMAGNAEELVRKARAHSPVVVVVDIQMPPTFSDDGLQAAHEIRTGDPKVAILVLSQFLEDQYAIDLLSDRPEGVGYLLKHRLADLESFTDAVRRVARGGSVVDAEVVSRLVGRRRRDDPLDGLTPREGEILALMAEGKSNKGIAEELVITVSAVERHVTSIFAKLGLPRKSEKHRRVLAVLQYLRT